MNVRFGATAKFFIFLSLVLFLAIVISYYVLLPLSGLEAQAQSSPSGKDNTKSGSVTVELTLLVYAIALGVVGIFNMYNALEIYRKKEQFDKELRDTVDSYAKSLWDLEMERKQMEFDYKFMQREISDLGKRVLGEVEDIGQKTNSELSNYGNQLAQSIREFQEKYAEIKDSIEQTTEEFHSFSVTMRHDFDRHFYTYTLYSVIPHYLLDEENRRNVESALFWFSQRGRLDDITILEERKSKIDSEDKDLIAICSKAIDEIRRRHGSQSSDNAPLDAQV